MGRVIFMPRMTVQRDVSPTAQGDVSSTAEGDVTLRVQGEVTPAVQGEVTLTLQGEVTPNEMQRWTRPGLQQDLHLYICAAC